MRRRRPRQRRGALRAVADLLEALTELVEGLVK